MKVLKTPMKAIRAKCVDCCCGNVQEVKLCTIKNCPLYPYKMGRRPSDKELVDLGLLKPQSHSRDT